MKTAEIARQLATLRAAFAVFDDVIKPQTNVVIDQFNDNKNDTPSAQFDATTKKFTVLSAALTQAKKAIADQITATRALVPSDPPIDPPPITPSGTQYTVSLLHPSEVAGFWFSDGDVIDDELISCWTDGTRTWKTKTGKVKLTPAVIDRGDGIPLTNNQLENGACIAVGKDLYRGNQGPGGVFHKYTPATGKYVNVAASSYADSAMMYDEPAQRLIGIKGNGYPFMTWPLPIPEIPEGGNLAEIPYVNEYHWETVVPPCHRFTLWRACMNVKAGRAMLLGNGNAVSELESGSKVFIERPTTGQGPPDDFCQPVYWPPTDTYFVFQCGSNDPLESTIGNRVFMLPRSTWHWQELSVAMPAGGALSNIYQNIIKADPANNQILIVAGSGNVYSMDMRGTGNVPSDLPADPPPPPPIIVTPPTTPNVLQGNFGTFASYALPTNPLAPFNSQRGSKQVGMAWLRGKLYAGNGDWVHSATNGWWRYLFENGATTCVELRPDAEPTAANPYPDSLQDGCGMFPNEAEGSILISPGDYYDYTVFREFARGAWKYYEDPDTFVQDTRIFGKNQENVGTGLVNTGNLYGGVDDPVNNHILVFNDESHGHPTLGKGVTTFDMTAGLVLPFQPVTFPPPAEDLQAIVQNFTSGRFCRIGRKCYFVGSSVNPYTDPWKTYFRLWSWDIDARVLTSLASPPVFQIGATTDQYTQLFADGNKIVFLVHNDTANGVLGHYEGDVYVTEPPKLLVYDTITNQWAEETGRPVGNWVYNTGCASPLGVVLCGAAASHMHCYKTDQAPFALAA